MSEYEARFATLRAEVDDASAAAIERLVLEGKDSELNRVNVLEFAARFGLDEDRAIAAFLHASRLGLFDMSWNLLCPGCSGVLDANATLKTVTKDEYLCSLCAVGYEPTLDEMVEVSFTVSPPVRRIAAHDPDSLSILDYYQQIYWSSDISLPEDGLEEIFKQIALVNLELAAGEKRVLDLQLPAQFVIVFDAVTHSAQFIDVQGEPTDEVQTLSVVVQNGAGPTQTVTMRPGPLTLTVENRTSGRTLPGVWIAAEHLHDLLNHRKTYLTAKRLVTNQTFRDLYRTDTLDVNQRLKITSLTFLFTDLKGSTELYERVGDLVAYDLVKSHFEVLNEVVAAEAGAVVKTIGDAVMATFPTPDRAMSAALRMRHEMRRLNTSHDRDDLQVKIGLHEGPCLAVTLNDRMDYFGQTVNIAARVQGLATSSSIFASEPVVKNPHSSKLLADEGLVPIEQQYELKGIHDKFTVYEIP